jgi:hypothetical protein
MSDKVLKGCGFPACGRPMRAMGLCQTHYKHQRRGEELKPIGPRRAKRKGTRRYAGLSLTEHCVSVIKKRAQRGKWAVNAVITDILEDWVRSKSKKK